MCTVPHKQSGSHVHFRSLSSHTRLDFFSSTSSFYASTIVCMCSITQQNYVSYTASVYVPLFAVESGELSLLLYICINIYIYNVSRGNRLPAFRPFLQPQVQLRFVYMYHRTSVNSMAASSFHLCLAFIKRLFIDQTFINLCLFNTGVEFRLIVFMDVRLIALICLDTRAIFCPSFFFSPPVFADCLPLSSRGH